MCQDDGLEPVRVLPEVLEVGQDQIDAGELCTREGETAVDDEDPTLQLEAGHVPADLADASQKNETCLINLPRPVLHGTRRRARVGVREGSIPPGPCGFD